MRDYCTNLKTELISNNSLAISRVIITAMLLLRRLQQWYPLWSHMISAFEGCVGRLSALDPNSVAKASSGSPIKAKHHLRAQ